MVAGTDAKQRLIDANELTDKVDKYICRITRASKGRLKVGESAILADIEAYIELSPTIEPEPVRYVKNIGTDYNEVDQFVCSECGIELQDWRRVERDDYDGEETYHEYRLRYCPNCGGRIVEE